MILNLKHLNKFSEKQYFKMETSLTILDMVTPGDTTIRQQFSLYIENTLDFILRNSFMNLHVYLTTNLGIRDDAVWKYCHSADLFQKLGFTIHISKSEDFPTEVLKHLGFIIDFIKMEVKMTEEKMRKILQIGKTVLQHGFHINRQIAKILGKLTTTNSGNAMAPFFTKNIGIENIEALSPSAYNFEAKMTLQEEAGEDLKLWQPNLAILTASIRQNKPNLGNIIASCTSRVKKMRIKGLLSFRELTYSLGSGERWNTQWCIIDF